MSNNTTIVLCAALLTVAILGGCYIDGVTTMEYMKHGYVERWNPFAQRLEWTHDTNHPTLYEKPK